jgi:predicted transposase/invertase (TIGR01784 family)
MKFIPLVDQRDEMLRQLVKEEGIEEGIEKVARNLLSMGLPVETIKKATGLNEATIRSLKKDMRVK